MASSLAKVHSVICGKRSFSSGRSTSGLLLRNYFTFPCSSICWVDFQGTQLYDAKAGGWKDLGMLDVMQVKEKNFFRKEHEIVISLVLMYHAIICIRFLEGLGDLSLTRVVKELSSHPMTSWHTISGC